MPAEGLELPSIVDAPGFERHVLDQLPSALIVIDADGVVRYWNRRAQDLYGARAADVIGRRFADLDRNPDPAAKAGLEATLEHVLAGGRWAGDSDAHLPGGIRVPVFASLERFVDPATGAIGVMCASIEITERRRVEDHLVYEARHDPLTKLPNRRMFLDHLETALRDEDAPPVAILFVDLDDFKEVNDAAGHAAGDAVLTRVGEVLRDVAGESHLVARLSGDEFVACCSGADGPFEAVALAERLLAALAGTTLPGGRHGIGASVGVALSTPGMHSEVLLRNADVAMYLAKERGRGEVQVFDDAVRHDRYERARVERELADAIVNDELEVHYQPIVELRRGTLLGFEALARWRHPERGLIGPDAFLAVAEQSGVIGAIGAVVLDEACRTAVGWTPSASGPQIAVNVSVRQLADPGFTEVVERSLARSGLAPQRLCLEVTETALMEAEVGVHHLTALQALGVHIAIDDFGVGYSSLGRLRRLPVDTLKIDRSFTAGLGRDEEDDEIVRAVVSLAKSLGLSVIIEGVEDEVQLAAAARLGCDAGQGYLWSYPLPGPATMDLVIGAVRFRPRPPIEALTAQADDADVLDALRAALADLGLDADLLAATQSPIRRG